MDVFDVNTAKWIQTLHAKKVRWSCLFQLPGLILKTELVLLIATLLCRYE